MNDTGDIAELCFSSAALYLHLSVTGHSCLCNSNLGFFFVPGGNSEIAADGLVKQEDICAGVSVLMHVCANGCVRLCMHAYVCGEKYSSPAIG